MKVPVKIPQNSDVLIEAGQRVDFTTPLLKRKGKQSVQIPIAELMRFPPDKIFLRLKKTIGDKVAQGDLLAEEKGLLSSKKYFSQVEGVLKEINHIEGSVIIEQDSNDTDMITCFFTGEIDAIYDGYLELKVKHAHKVEVIEPIDYIGAELYYTPSTGTMFVEEDINGKCIVTTELDPMDHSKIEALGARGLVLTKKIPSLSLAQIILPKEADLEMIVTKQYPYLIAGPEENTLYFYE